MATKESETEVLVVAHLREVIRRLNDAEGLPNNLSYAIVELQSALKLLELYRDDGRSEV